MKSLKNLDDLGFTQMFLFNQVFGELLAKTTPKGTADFNKAVSIGIAQIL